LSRALYWQQLRSKLAHQIFGQASNMKKARTMNLRVAFALTAIWLLATFVARTDSSAEMRSRSLNNQQLAKSISKSATPVLVELFTSEGCSSCPPADKLLAQIDARQPVSGAGAIILEEHVDYWDDQGWRDPFASKAATERQQDYANSLHAEVYTPQMVVDGRAELLGSDQNAAQRAIEKAISAQKTSLELTWVGATMTVGGPKLLRVRVGKLSGDNSSSGQNAEVFLAITESHLHSDVRRGENAGRGLEHDGVVRKLTSLGKARGSGEFSFDLQTGVKLSPEWKRENIRVIDFEQDVHSRRIYAATSTTY
jgi:hypothetical protein